MKFELDLIRKTVRPIEGGVKPDNVLEFRRSTNVEAVRLVHDALLPNRNTHELLEACALWMRSVVTVLEASDQEPQLEDFIYGVAETVTLCRKCFDDALKSGVDADVRIAAVMIELVVRGVFATLGSPYETVFSNIVRGDENAES